MALFDEQVYSSTAGLQMAPCGCFFDPRIYRIEWTTNDFAQPSLCKVLLGPPSYQGSVNPNTPKPQRLIKNTPQANLYAQYLPPTANNQYILSHFNQEVAAPLPEQTPFIPNTLNETPSLTIFNIQNQGLNPKELNVPQLLITIPDCQQDSFSFSSNADGSFNEIRSQPDQFSLTNVQQQQRHQELRCKESFQGKELELAGEVLKVYPGSQIGLPIMIIPNKVHQHLHQESIAQSQADQAFETNACLPDQILLEDAMKMFDCIPAHSGFGRESVDCLSSPKDVSDVLVASNGIYSPCKDSLSDFSMLNLPDELISPDYMVPDVSEALSTMDYFYDISEELCWDFDCSMKDDKSELSQPKTQDP
ncbi:hypothetical protein FKM82_017360, partial [Ascaphus truei]